MIVVLIKVHNLLAGLMIIVGGIVFLSHIMRDIEVRDFVLFVMGLERIYANIPILIIISLDLLIWVVISVNLPVGYSPHANILAVAVTYIAHRIYKQAIRRI